jgi:hypothetical protein
MNADGSCELPFFSSAYRPALVPAWRPGSLPLLPPLRCVDLDLTGVADRDVAAAGRPVTLELRVANDGTDTAGVTLEVEPNAPGVAAGTLAGAQCVGTGTGLLVCELAALARGDSDGDGDGSSS